MSVTILGWDDYPALGVDFHLPVVLVTSGMVIGGAVGLLFLSVVTFMKRKAAHRQAAVLFLAAVFNLILLSGFCLVQIILVQHQIASEGFRAFGASSFFVTSSTTGLRRVRIILEQIMMIVGDFVVLGRARAIYPEQRWTGNILFTLWIIYVGWGVAFYIILSIHIDNPETYHSLNTYAYVFTGLSATINLLASGLIASKLWSYRRFLKKEIRLPKSPRTRAHTTLLTMVESGFVYRVTQNGFFTFSVIVVSHGKVNSTRSVANALSIIQHLFYIICGLYPVSVRFLLSARSRSEGNISTGGRDSST